MRTIKPPRLKKGDTIGIVSPGSSAEDPHSITKGVSYLENLGYKVELGKYAEKSNGYLAGTDDERVKDIHSMFNNKKIRAIICLRGGYGTARLLDKINYKLIRSNPKIFVGYSDITALQMAIFQKAGLVTFAGPMLSSEFGKDISSYTEEFFWRVVTSNKKIGRIKLKDNGKLAAISKGGTSGRIVGGNLSVLGGIIGSEYFPDVKDKILFLEDVGEKPYKVDRVLNLFRLNKVFRKIKGIIFGRFVDCYEHDPSKKTLTLGEVMEDYFKGAKIPIVYTFPFGHITDKVTIPFGINIKMNASRGFVEYSEGAVT